MLLIATYLDQTVSDIALDEASILYTDQEFV